MKSELANRLKEVLDSMTQEQFDQEWAAIAALNLESPSLGEVLEYYVNLQSQSGSFELSKPLSDDYYPTDNSLVLAA